MNKCQLFRIFLWKILKEYKFSWKFKSLFLVIIPLLLIFLNIKLAHVHISNPTQTLYDETDKESIDYYFPGNSEDKLFYYPQNNWTQSLMEDVRNHLQIIYQRIKGFSSIDELERSIRSNSNQNLFAVIFHEIPNSNQLGLNYTIRSRNLNLPTNLIFRNKYNELNARELDEYMVSGFVALQTTINDCYMQRLNIKPLPMAFEHFPSESADEIVINTDISSFTILMIVICWLNVVNTVLIPMVTEKENEVRSILKIATKYFYFNEVARLTVNVSFFIIFFGLIFAMAQFYQLWGAVTFIYPFVLSILFGLAIISYTIALSLLFKTVEFCRNAGILCYAVPFFAAHLPSASWNITKLKYLLPSNMFLEGMSCIQAHVLTQRDIGLSLDYDIPPSSTKETEPNHLFVVYGVLMFNSIFYFVVYLLLKNVESKHSAKKTFDTLMRKKWSHKVENSVDTIRLQRSSQNSIVQVVSVCKNYYSWSKVKEAVKNVSLDVANNEITVLLGHNGAGKTTLLSMITGIIKPSNGTISVGGYSDPKQYEQMIGYCPQKNVFIEQFNCLDHVKFFGQLRGLKSCEVTEDSLKVLDDVNLGTSAHKYPNQLSGGMKRRLCLAISVIGHTKLVILDEPTSGLDPKNRRDLWDIMLKLKKDRAILLTTHYMEEADILADTVAIMQDGVIVCEGSPLALKREHTSGYILKIVSNAGVDPKGAETERVLFKEVPNYSRKSNTRPTVSYNIPYEYQDNYSTLLRRLETDKKSLNIDSVSITNPPLEEVFLQCSSHEPCTDEVDEVDSKQRLIPESRICVAMDYHLFWLQIKGVLYKKMIHLKNDWFSFLFLISLPFAAFFLSQFLICLSLFGTEQDTIKLSYEGASPRSTILVALNNIQSSKYSDSELIKSLFEKGSPDINFEFVMNEEDLQQLLVRRSADDIHFYNEKLCAAIQLNLNDAHPKAVVFFSGNLYHGSVKTTNLVANFLLQYSEESRHSFVETWNRPILRKTEEINRGHVFIYENLMPFGIFFYILFYSIDPFNDNITQFKSLFTLSPTVYWIMSFVFDMIVHLVVIVVLTMVSIFSNEINYLFDAATYAKIGLIFFVYAVPVIPLLYILSKYMKCQENLYSTMSYLAVIGMVLSQLLSTSDEKVREYEMESTLLYVLPDFGIRHGMSLAIFQYFTGRKTDGRHDEVYELFFYYTITISVGALILCLLVWVSESLYWEEKLSNFSCRNSTKNNFKSDSKDRTDGDVLNADVTTERNETETLCRTNSDPEMKREYPVIVFNLKKKYDDNFAVNDLCFKVKTGECFGLLGTNGAGKTSTLQMMTLNMAVTDGVIYLNNVNIKNNENEYKRSFGYCPQIDALNKSMTAYETLKYLALIKGVIDVEAETKKWLYKCDLENYANVSVMNYSGGTKRKLNTAIAMIGSPKVIFLDEPTTGIDPVSRRKIWKCIKDLKNEGKTIILTSHSLDECEHLCNRIGIMYNGNMHCIGVTQKLKNDFGDGYTLIIKLTEDVGNTRVRDINTELRNLQFVRCEEDVMRLDKERQLLFEQAVYGMEKEMRKLGLDWKNKDQHGQIVKYRINRKEIIWSEVFEILTELRSKCSAEISDYSVNEVSLEDIFLQIGQPRLLEN